LDVIVIEEFLLSFGTRIKRNRLHIWEMEL
jgi:hypothetical protein